jgi:hypothetical protein
MVGESGDWNDAARKQPIDGRSVLALLPMDNAGFTPDAGHTGKARVWGHRAMGFKEVEDRGSQRVAARGPAHELVARVAICS